MKIEIRKVAVIGTGTLGTQIAIHSSFHGYEVSAYDPDEKAFQKVLEMIRVRVANSNREPTLSLEEIQKPSQKDQAGQKPRRSGSRG